MNEIHEKEKCVRACVYAAQVTHNHRHAHTSTLTITFAIAIARARAVRVSAFFARAIFAPLPPRLPAPGHAPRPGSRRGETIN